MRQCLQHNLASANESLKRLGVFGFWTDPNNELENNFGLLDQRLAMQWVKEWVAAFSMNEDIWLLPSYDRIIFQISVAILIVSPFLAVVLVCIWPFSDD